jgi:hypothetical protein
MIKIEIGNYERDYAKGLLEREEPKEIISALFFHLRKSHFQAYSDVCCLIRNLVLGPFESNKNKTFNSILDDSKVVKVLEKNVLSGNYFQRSSSIYTLGKICSTKSIPILTKALVPLALRDPINGSDLISEIWWLQPGKKNLKLLDKMNGLGFYQRWAGLHVLTHWSGTGEFGKRITEYLKKYAMDENPLIRIEAEHQLKEKRQERNSRNKKVSEQADLIWEPRIRFDFLRNKIGGILIDKRKSEYSIKDLDNLVDIHLKSTAV